jgi:CRISPR type I-E-associated protein CasB/Cse2
LRQESQRAPEREVAWLIAKLYATTPVPQAIGATLPRQLRRCQPQTSTEGERFRLRFDRMLLLSPGAIEPALRWALWQVSAKGLGLDWAKLTDDLSIWEREATRLRWAKEFLGIDERS